MPQPRKMDIGNLVDIVQKYSDLFPEIYTLKSDLLTIRHTRNKMAHQEPLSSPAVLAYLWSLEAILQRIVIPEATSFYEQARALRLCFTAALGQQAIQELTTYDPFGVPEIIYPDLIPQEFPTPPGT